MSRRKVQVPGYRITALLPMIRASVLHDETSSTTSTHGTGVESATREKKLHGLFGAILDSFRSSVGESLSRESLELGRSQIEAFGLH